MTSNTESQIQRTLFRSNITHEDCLAVIRAMLFTPGRRVHGLASNEIVWGIPMMIWDEPGTGKTSIVAQEGRRYFKETKIHYMAQHPAEDVGGYGIPNNDRSAIDQVPAAFFKRLNEQERALLILDEFGSIEEHKQAAGLAVLSERLAGSTQIGPNVRIMALGNPPEVAANGVPLSPPAANRMIHFPWVRPGFDIFSDFLGGAGVLIQSEKKEDPELIERRVVKEWPRCYSRAYGYVSQYLRSSRQHLQQMPHGCGVDGEGEADELRWASPRMWETLTRALAGAYAHDLNSSQIAYLVRSALPAGIAASFLESQNKLDLGDPKEILEQATAGNVWKAPQNRLDIVQATAQMLASYVCDPSVEELERVSVGFWRVLQAMKKSKAGGKDIVTECAIKAAKVRSMVIQGTESARIFEEFSSDIHDEIALFAKVFSKNAV